MIKRIVCSTNVLYHSQVDHWNKKKRVTCPPGSATSGGRTAKSAGSSLLYFSIPLMNLIT